MIRAGLLACLVWAACAGREPPARTPAAADPEAACATAGKTPRASDGDGNGKADTTELVLGGRVTCRIVDTNADGRPDLERAFDASGALLRLRLDVDHDGRFDRTESYQGGRLARRELDSNADGKVDLRLFFAGGELERIEQDQDDDGRVDYWEFYERGLLARVGFDPYGSGKPEKIERVEGRERRRYIEGLRMIEGEKQKPPAAAPASAPAKAAPRPAPAPARPAPQPAPVPAPASPPAAPSGRPT